MRIPPVWLDQSQLLRKLNYQRLRNGFALYQSYQKTRQSGKVEIGGWPMSLAVEPTTACNLRCPHCPSGLRSFERPTGRMNLDLYRDILDQVAPHLLYLTLYFQGEPYIHPQFLDMVSYARKKNIYTATSSNAHFLDDDRARQTVESGLNRIVVSIDGTTQASYAHYRVGGKLEKVIEGTRNLIAWKKKLKRSTPHVIFQFIVFKSNQHQIQDIRKLARELKVDALQIKTAQIYDLENADNWVPEEESLSRYARNDQGKFQIKNELLNHCWRMWQGCVLTWDGKVVPCCFDKDAQHSLGDLQQQSFADIWWGAKYQGFREQLFRSRRNIDICQNCTEGTRVFASPPD